MNSKRFILIIDDLEQQKNFIRDSLEKDYTVLHARDLDTAKEYLNVYGLSVSAVFINASMSDLSCKAFFEWLPESPHSTLPVIAITESVQQQSEVLSMGAWDYIAIPTTRTAIENRLRNIIACYHYLNGNTNDTDKPIRQQAELDNLLQSIDGGAGVFRISEVFSPVYYSDGLPILCGCDRENFSQWINGNLLNIIYFDDRDRLRTELHSSLKKNNNATIYCRIYQNNASLVWAKFSFALLENDSDEYICHLVVQKMSHDDTICDAVTGASDTAVYISEIATNRILYVNDNFIRCFGKNKSNPIGETCQKFFYDSDAPCVHCKISQLNDGETWERIYKFDHKLYKVKGIKTIWHKIPVAIEFLQENTAEIHQNNVFNRMQHILETALANSKIYTWEYDAGNDLLIEHENYLSNQPPRLLKNIPETLIADGEIHPQSFENARNFFRELKAGTKKTSADLLLRLPGTDTYRWIQTTCMLDNTNQDSHRYIGIGVDISDKKNLTKQFNEMIALQESRNTGVLANLTQNTVDSSLYSKSILMEKKEFTVDEFLKRVIDSIVDSEKRTFLSKHASRQKLIAAYENGMASLDEEAPCKQLNGEVRITEMHLKMSRDPQTGDLWAYFYLVDVHEQRLIQQITDKIAMQNYDFILLLDLNRDSAKLVSILESDAVKLVSDEFCKAYQQGIITFCDRYINPESIDETVQALSTDTILRNLDRNATYQVTLSLVNHNTKRFTFSYLHKDSRQVMLTSEDVTELIRQEADRNRTLSEALAKAEKANAAKTEFLSNMSHDMRTPMNAIIGFSEMSLMEDLSPETMRNYLWKINNSGHYLMELINDILDMSKIESKTITLNIIPINLKEFFNELLDTIEPLMEKSHISFDFQLLNIQNDKMILADKTRLQQIFTNILTNACRFTPPNGNITLKFECREDHDESIVCRASVRDNGCGMSKEFQSRCFQPFEQERNDQNTRSTGTGLGLFIVKNLVDLMGGCVNIISEPGVGTEVLIDLTFTTITPAFSDEPIFHEKTDLDGCRVLLCEDHPLNAELALVLLETAGIQADVAINGLLGVEAFKDSEPGYYDAILMDIRMPVMNGLEATKKIRQLDHPDAKNIPIIAMTANTFPDDIEASFNAGMTAHLAKPIDPANLFATLQKFIKK